MLSVTTLTAFALVAAAVLVLVAGRRLWVLAQAKAHAASGVGRGDAVVDDRRHAARFPAAMPAELFVPGEAAPRPATALDRTPRGARLATAAPVPVGAEVRLRAGGAPADMPWGRAVVRWCRPAGDGYHVGCEFAPPLPGGD